jgi:hypothetical protein
MTSAIIDEALIDPEVRKLFDEVQFATPIEFVKKATDCWGSTTTNGRTEITYGPTKHPSAALAHELLHAKLKISGYRQHVTVCSMDEDQDTLMDVVHAMDNELQHHRMFRLFLDLGFKAEHFYNDGDASTFSSVSNTLQSMNASMHPSNPRCRCLHSVRF